MQIRGLLLAALIALPVLAQPTEPFEVAVAGASAPEICFIGEVPLRLATQWFHPDRLDVETGFGISRIASPDHQRVFQLDSSGGPVVTIDVITPSGTRTPFFSGLPLAGPTTIAAAPNGRVVVPYRQGLTGVFVAVISATGVLEATYPVLAPGRIDSASVGPDNCTLLYTTPSSHTVGRFDVCTGTALTPFTTAVFPRDVEVLPDGRVLVVQEEEVLLYSSAAVLERTFSLATYGLSPDFDAMQAAASADGARLYIGAGGCGDTGILLEVQLSNGAEISRRTIGFGLLASLVTGLSASAAAVPTASEVVLLMLACALALVAVVRVR